jgi:hypothetical protein
VATRKRKTTYPPARTDTKPTQRPGAGPETYVRPTVATIDPTATTGKAGFAIGDRVRITGAGLYAGEAAIIERLTTGVIPGALVRTEAGRTRQVRTVDLDRLPPAAVVQPPDVVEPTVVVEPTAAIEPPAEPSPAAKPAATPTTKPPVAKPRSTKASPAKVPAADA